MPAQYVIDVSNRIVRTTFHGLVTYQQVADLAATLANDGTFDPDFSELIVFESGADIQLQFSHFQQLSRVDPFSKNALRALVVPSRGVLYGVARIYQTFRDSSNVSIFESEEAAMFWLSARERRAC
jgi:hypothetical protein